MFGQFKVKSKRDNISELSFDLAKRCCSASRWLRKQPIIHFLATNISVWPTQGIKAIAETWKDSTMDPHPDPITFK